MFTFSTIQCLPIAQLALKQQRAASSGSKWAIYSLSFFVKYRQTFLNDMPVRPMIEIYGSRADEWAW